MNTNKLRKNINKFYQHYNLERPFDTTTLTKDDMYDHDVLMTAYEAIGFTMEQYDNVDENYVWLSRLYSDLGDYLDGTLKTNTVSILNVIMSIFCICATNLFVTVMIVYNHISLPLVGGAVLGLIASIYTHIDR